MIRLALLLLLTACSPSVLLYGNGNRGYGVALSPTTVLTVDHVAEDCGLEVVQRWKRPIEDLVVVNWNLWLSFASLAPLVKGDSGSPLYNADGDVVGLVWGYNTTTGLIYVIPVKKR